MKNFDKCQAFLIQLSKYFWTFAKLPLVMRETTGEEDPAALMAMS
jgi:hypothetical protein